MLESKVEVHIIIGCADARDLSKAFMDAKKDVAEGYRQRGIGIDIQRISTPGSFVTNEVIGDVKTILAIKAKQYHDKEVTFFIHVNTHGDGELLEGVDKAFKVRDFRIVLDAKFNCGMLGADTVAEEMQAMLFEKRPVFTFGTRRITIENSHELNDLLREKYGHTQSARGPFGGWIGNIEDLRVHAKVQAQRLMEAIYDEREFSRLRDRIFFTAGVQDYADSQYFRVDGQRNLLTFLDEVYNRTAEKLRLPDYKEERETRIARQTPVLGLIHMGQIENAREFAVEIAKDRLRRDLPDEILQGIGDFMGGMVFAMSSTRMDTHFAPMDPYHLTGFFYAVEHLKLKHWLIMGRNDEETTRILKRITGDRLMSFFVTELGVTLHPVNLNSYLRGGNGYRVGRGQLAGRQ